MTNYFERQPAVSGRPAEVLASSTLAALRELNTADEPDALAALFNLYLDGSSAQLDALRQAVTAADAPAIARTAHALKSGSSAIGALNLSALCTALETAGRAGAVSGASATLAALETEYARVRVALASEIAGLASADTKP